LRSGTKRNINAEAYLISTKSFLNLQPAALAVAVGAGLFAFFLLLQAWGSQCIRRGRVPEGVEVGDTVDVGDLVAVATAVTGWVRA